MGHLARVTPRSDTRRGVIGMGKSTSFTHECKNCGEETVVIGVAHNDTWECPDCGIGFRCELVAGQRYITQRRSSP